jgi:CheY-like chemotaxis protein
VQEIVAEGPRSNANGTLLSGVHVLVVDDEADTRATLDAVLQQYGARPTLAATASDAMEMVRQSPPDVLLSDIAMPGEDGYTLIRRIRASVDAARLPAAALTAYGDHDSRAHAVEAGFQEYLTKPIDPVSLAQTLARLLDRGRDLHTT